MNCLYQQRRFPHTSFIWEGLDGSSVVAHFPSADTYGAECNVAETVKSVTNNKSMCVLIERLYIQNIT